MGPVLSVLLACAAVPAGASISEGRVVVPAELVENHTYVDIRGAWRFQAGDDPAWASPDHDDSQWPFVDPALPGGVPAEWSGAGWYRLRLAAPGLANKALVLWVVQIGTVDLYIDGQRVGGLGDASQPMVMFTPAPIPVVLPAHEVVIALRMRTPKAALRVIAGAEGECAVSLGRTDSIPDRNRKSMNVIRRYRFFIGVSFALGLLHFLLFVFLPERKENLQYALSTWAICGLSFFVETRATPVSETYFIVASYVGFRLCLLATVVFGIKFYHKVLGDPVGPWFKLYVGVGVVLALLTFQIPIEAVYLYAVVGIFEQTRLALAANMQGRQDAWLLAVGVALSGFGAILQIGPPLLGQPLPVPHAYLYGFLGMLLSMSAYQARVFARTYRSLQHRLAEVRRLNEREMEQEMARIRLEEENKRQADALRESARREEVVAQLEAANRNLKEAQSQLVQTEKMASLGQLVAGIAHEINTPVGAIQSVHDSLRRATDRLKATLASEDPRLLEDNRRLKASLKVIDDAIGVIESGSGRVAKIVRRLKSFARLDDPELMRADVHEGLDDTLLLLHHELKRDVRVHRQYGEVPPFPCYPSQLNQVFLNLLVNARQSMEGPGEIFITTRVVDAQAHVAIRDTGIGIPEDIMARIFDPGFTTKGVKVGTGLGLSICYRIVKEHQGRIDVDSEVGQGSTFTVVLPLNLDERLGVVSK